MVPTGPDQPGPPAAERAAAIPALTGVRFVFALAVVLYHVSRPGGPLDGFGQAHWPGFCRQVIAAGYIGVQCFYVLSGFILTHTYHGLTAARQGGFYRARLARIYPVFLLGCLLSLPQWPQSGWLAVVVLPIWLLLMHAWVSAEISGNSADWSLSVEAFFYSLFPPLLRRMEAATTARLFTVAGALWASVMAVALGLYLVPGTSLCGTAADQGLSLDYSPTVRLLLFNPLVYLPDFLIGMATCLAWRRGVFSPRVLAWLSWCAPLALMLICGGLLDRLPLMPVFVGLLAPLCALLVLGLTAQSGPARLLGTRPMVALGEASFAFYVLHLPLRWYLALLNVQVLHLAFDDGWYLVIYLTALTLLSLAVFRWYEEPLRRRLRWPGDSAAGSRRSLRLIALSIAIASAAIVAGGTTIVRSERERGRAAFAAELAQPAFLDPLAAPLADSAPPTPADPGVAAWTAAAATALPGDEADGLAGVFNSPGFDPWLQQGQGDEPAQVGAFWQSHRDHLRDLLAVLARPDLRLGVLSVDDEIVPATLLPVHNVGLAFQIAARADAAPGPWLDGLDDLQQALVPVDGQAQAMQLLMIGALRDQAYLACALVGSLDAERAGRWLAEPAGQCARLADGLAAERRLVAIPRCRADLARGPCDTFAIQGWSWTAWQNWREAGAHAANTLSALRMGEARLRGIDAPLPSAAAFTAASAVDAADPEHVLIADHVAKALAAATRHRMSRLAVTAVIWWRAHDGRLPADDAGIAAALGPGVLAAGPGRLALRAHVSKPGDGQVLCIDVDPATPWPVGADPRGPAGRAAIALDLTKAVRTAAP